MTYGELDRRARVIAARLQLELQPGDRALLVYPPGLDFIAAFFGCLYAGVVAVPATYPKPRRPMPRLNRIARRLRCSRGALHRRRRSRRSTPICSRPTRRRASGSPPTNCTTRSPSTLSRRWSATSDLAFLQYTSGSTSDPKGVMVSHANLINNLECIRQAFGIGEVEEDHVSATGVFWLPAYHDMGLIGGILTPLYMGGRSVLMSPTAFLQRPLRWLQAIHEYQATISGAPNFAYDYCARRTRAGGAGEARPEPLAAGVLRRRADSGRNVRAVCRGRAALRFPSRGRSTRATGWRRSTLLAAGPDFRSEPTVLVVNRHALSEHRVAQACGEPEEMTQQARRLRPGDDRSHAALDRSRRPMTVCGPDEVGEILIQGPSVAGGYWNRPEETDGSVPARACPASRAVFCGPATSASSTTASCTSLAGSRT